MQSQHLSPGDVVHSRALFCEACCSQMVRRNPVAATLADIGYMSGEIVRYGLESAPMFINSIKALYKRPVRKHTHRAGQTACEVCLSDFASSGIRSLDRVNDFFYVSFELTKMLAGVFATATFGTALFVVTLFPSMVRSRSHEELEAAHQERLRKDREFEERKEADWQASQQDKQEWEARSLRIWNDNRAAYREWDEQRQKHWDERVKQHHRSLDEYREVEFRLRNQSSRGLWDEDSEREDNQRTSAVENIMRGVENGVEDPERAAREAAAQERFREATRQEQRTRHYTEYRDHQFRSNELLKEADEHERNGNFPRAAQCRREAETERCKSEESYQSYLAV